jgi:hypothetical protein
MQTETDEDATSGFCTNTSSPIMPLAPCLQAAKVKERSEPSMSQKPGVSAVLPPALQVEGLGVADGGVAGRPDLEVGRLV